MKNLEAANQRIKDLEDEVSKLKIALRNTKNKLYEKNRKLNRMIEDFSTITPVIWFPLLLKENIKILPQLAALTLFLGNPEE